MPRLNTQFLINHISRLQADRKITPAFADRLRRQIKRLTVDGTVDHAELLRVLHVIATDDSYLWMDWVYFWAEAGEAFANGLINGYPKS